MPEIVSIAYVEPAEGKDEETLQILSELYDLMVRKGYSRNLLYRDPRGRFINLRYWASEEMRDEAHEDPEVHRMWQRLAEVSTVEVALQNLQPIEGSWSAIAR